MKSNADVSLNKCDIKSLNVELDKNATEGDLDLIAK